LVFSRKIFTISRRTGSSSTYNTLYMVISGDPSILTDGQYILPAYR
jgi:hypothetical protein